MKQVGRRVALRCVIGLAILGVGQLTVESQAKDQAKDKTGSTRLARLYFLREKGALGGLQPAPEVKVDGQTVGKIDNGAFIVLDRPPGLHLLAVGNAFAMNFETEIQLEAGQSYYFNIAPQASGVPLQDLAVSALIGGKGRAMQPKSSLRGALAGIIFYRLEPAAGAAEIERLKTP